MVKGPRKNKLDATETPDTGMKRMRRNITLQYSDFDPPLLLTVPCFVASGGGGGAEFTGTDRSDRVPVPLWCTLCSSFFRRIRRLPLSAALFSFPAPSVTHTMHISCVRAVQRIT